MTITPGKTIADGASLPYIGGMVDFSLIKSYTDEILETTDERLVEGMKFFAQTMKIIVEPTGCLGYAGMRQCGYDFKGKKIGVIISGGNVDLSKFAKLVGDI